MLENASFVHVFGCMCMLELTITGWWIIVAYLSIPNWFELQLVSQLATYSYLFSYFLLRSLLPFSNSKFLLISCLFTFYRILWLVTTMLNKTPRVQKKARPIRSSSYQVDTVYVNIFVVDLISLFSWLASIHKNFSLSKVSPTKIFPTNFLFRLGTCHQTDSALPDLHSNIPTSLLQ